MLITVVSSPAPTPLGPDLILNLSPPPPVMGTSVHAGAKTCGPRMEAALIENGPG